jgi:hypothetical protein
MRNATRVILFLTLIQVNFLLAKGAGPTAQNPPGEGLLTTSFETPQGKVSVYFPDDMRPGDTISGTVIEVPSAAGSLTGYVIDIGGMRIPVSQRQFKFVIPKISASSLIIVLMDAAGGEVGRNSVAIKASTRISDPNFVMPRIGQTGRSIQIIGPFDGDSSNTRCSVAGTPIPILAESPGKVVIPIPAADGVANTNITMTEGGRNTKSDFRIIGVSLSAPKTRLAKGEKTTLSLKVTGLEGINQDLPLDVETTGVVETQGGNRQRITIRPAEVKADGSVVITREMTGLSAGNFSVVATVIPATPKPD